MKKNREDFSYLFYYNKVILICQVLKNNFYYLKISFITLAL